MILIRYLKQKTPKSIKVDIKWHIQTSSQIKEKIYSSNDLRIRLDLHIYAFKKLKNQAPKRSVENRQRVNWLTASDGIGVDNRFPFYSNR